MKILCEYCNSQYEDTLTHCPNCGAPNQIRKEDHQPRTIAELQEWYQSKNLPPYETTRFFIGINYTEPKAFGIYKDTNGEFVVYKNKADGSRAVRYRGKDEAYAVNEILMKLKDEIANQKANQRTRRQNINHAAGFDTKEYKHGVIIGWLRLVIIVFAISTLLNGFSRYVVHRNDGYYSYNNMLYYDYDDDWYYYSTATDSWQRSYDPPQQMTSNLEDYYQGSDYHDSYNASDWEDSSWYDDYKNSSSDSGYDWDSGSSWDSGGTDWDSDW